MHLKCNLVHVVTGFVFVVVVLNVERFENAVRFAVDDLESCQKRIQRLQNLVFFFKLDAASNLALHEFLGSHALRRIIVGDLGSVYLFRLFLGLATLSLLFLGHDGFELLEFCVALYGNFKQRKCGGDLEVENDEPVADAIGWISMTMRQRAAVAKAARSDTDCSGAVRCSAVGVVTLAVGEFVERVAWRFVKRC